MGLLDVVNIADKIIGHADYTEVHRRGLRHRSVNIWAVNAEGQLAVSERSGEQEVSAHKYHPSAGGHPRLGQPYEWAMIDQLQDELFHGESLPDDPVITEIARYQNDTKAWNKENTVLYVFNWSGPFTLNPNETREIFWRNPSTIIDELAANGDRYTQTFKNAFEKYLDWLGAS